MTDFTTDAFYLGNLNLVQPGDPGAEGAGDTSQIYGTYGDATNPMAKNVVSVTSYNDGSTNIVDQDNSTSTPDDPNGGTGDGFFYDLNGDGINDYNGPMDYFNAVYVDVVYTDGSTGKYQVWYAQMPNGDTFLMPNISTGGGVDENGYTQDTSKWTQVPIESLTISQSTSTTFGATSDTLAGYNMAQGFHSLAAPIICFASGSLIKTRAGEIAVEDLQLDAEVLTFDSGYQPVRWIGSRTLSAADLAANPNLRPIRIRAGALGPNQPVQDLIVSPQHRVLVRSKVAERMFGEAEVLVAAKHLVTFAGIEIAEDLTEVTYWHFLFDSHQIVFSNGALTESMFTGAEALKSVGAAAREEILAIFPGLVADPAEGAAPVRLLIPGRQARKFAERLGKHRKTLVA